MFDMNREAGTVIINGESVLSSMTTSSASGMAWNGPICGTCGARYLGCHTCTQSDIIRRIKALEALLDREPRQRDCDPMRSCPCRTENGGSGVCGCVLSGPRIT